MNNSRKGGGGGKKPKQKYEILQLPEKYKESLKYLVVISVDFL
jgi:hypothetical protein